jgi:hypothetical protein
MLYLTSPNGSFYKLTVDDMGALSTTKVSFDENGDEIVDKIVDEEEMPFE